MKILVTAASKHGSTDEIATDIAEGLRQRGLDAAVRHPEDVTSLDHYVAVIIGSAVYNGQWLAPAKSFVDRWSDALKERQVWLFSSGPAGDPPKPTQIKAVDVAAIVAATNARAHQVFAGKIDKAALGFAERTVVRTLHIGNGDSRDWSQIDAWAGEIAEALTAGGGPGAPKATRASG